MNGTKGVMELWLLDLTEVYYKPTLVFTDETMAKWWLLQEVFQIFDVYELDL